MPTLYIASTFTSGMLDLAAMAREGYSAVCIVKVLSVDKAKKLVHYYKAIGYSIKSCVGHQSTASLLKQVLGIDVEVNRTPVTLEPGDVVLCLQLMTRPGKELDVTELLKLMQEGKAYFIAVYVTYM